MKMIHMKKIYFLLVVSSLFIFSCTGETKEEADQTNRDSTESRSTDTSMNTGSDTSGATHNPAAPAATNAEF